MSLPGNITPEDLHPRTTSQLVGHKINVDIFLKSLASGRLHHAWLLAGPRGVGKATFAYHCARYLLAGAKGEFVMTKDSPIFAHITAGSEGNLKVIERRVNEKTGRRRQDIVVDDVRSLHAFFEQTGTHEGWRIAIIDAADEMNRSASNALLKMLEEPPKQTILLLISHARGRLMATIRSRCQQLLFNPLSDEEVSHVLAQRLPDLEHGEIKSLATLSEGSPGFAIRLALYKGLSLRRTIEKLLSGQALKTEVMHKLASDLGGFNADEAYFLFLDILKAELSSKIKEAALEPGKTRLDCWLTLWEKVDQIQYEGEGLNLGRKQQLILLFEDLNGLKARPHQAA